MKGKIKMAVNFDYDFSGYATKANTKCYDGLIIAPNAFADDIQRTLQCGMNTHFNKPVDMDSICAALHYWLEHDKGNRP